MEFPPNVFGLKIGSTLIPAHEATRRWIGQDKIALDFDGEYIWSYGRGCGKLTWTIGKLIDDIQRGLWTIEQL